MQPDRWRSRVGHIIEAIDRIGAYTSGLDQRAIEADQKTLDAVVRNLEIIGEASRAVPDDVKAISPDIPWRLMQDMRNFLTHEYHKVDASIVLQTIHEELPPLRVQLDDLLRKHGGRDPS